MSVPSRTARGTRLLAVVSIGVSVLALPKLSFAQG
jgi:hypothetical protein